MAIIPAFLKIETGGHRSNRPSSASRTFSLKMINVAPLQISLAVPWLRGSRGKPGIAWIYLPSSPAEWAVFVEFERPAASTTITARVKLEMI